MSVDVERLDCDTCAENEGELNECAKSPRACGHHCNHTWESDACCWCGTVIGEENDRG